MTYRITHKTTYQYNRPVSFGNHAALLKPRSQPQCVCTWNQLRIAPAPATKSERIDYFGNHLTIFTIQEPHERLEIEARSEVTLNGDRAPWPKDLPPWDEVARSLPFEKTPAALDAYQFVFESPRIQTGAEFASYASPSFPPGRSLTEALLDLTGRIYADFRFDPKATGVRTGPGDVLLHRRGVCQDFAQLEIACLRSLNLAARYVSGYLRTHPPPGSPRLAGADASHAWVSVYCPGAGWLDVDPTNNLVPSTGHVTVAWGRDYGDVSPVRGVILGGRDHTLEVAVDMEPID